jgi:predicted dehydrogenase
VKIAMIGAGFANRHLGVLHTEPGVEIVGHVVRAAEARDAQTQHWGGRGYADLESLLKAEKTVDAVWVAVPPDAHGRIERLLLERDIPFFVEKPLSADRRTAEEIGELIDKKRGVVGVGYHWRALDTLPGVREKLAENPPRMVMGAWHDRTPPPGWWRHQASSGGQMVEQATHVIDLARALLGNAVVRDALAFRHTRSQYPDADVDGVSSALLRFPNDTLGVFTATCILGGKAEVQLQLMCEGLLITITQTSVTYDYGREKVEIATGADPILAENRAFIQAVPQRNPSLLYSSYSDALHTHRLCHDILEASQRR